MSSKTIGALVLVVVIAAGFAPVSAKDRSSRSTSTTRRDSGGNTITKTRSRERSCTETCRRDSGNNLVCRTVCR